MRHGPFHATLVIDISNDGLFRIISCDKGIKEGRLHLQKPVSIKDIIDLLRGILNTKSSNGVGIMRGPIEFHTLLRGRLYFSRRPPRSTEWRHGSIQGCYLERGSCSGKEREHSARRETRFPNSAILWSGSPMISVGRVTYICFLMRISTKSLNFAHLYTNYWANLRAVLHNKPKE